MSSKPDPAEFDPDNPRLLAADELLPPVEPPSASFILQLFVVPAVIVLVVVMLGWLVTAMASANREPEAIIANLRSSSQLRWQEASDLGDMLSMPEAYPEIRQSKELATGLAALLEEEVELGRDDPDSITMRTFLCWALRSFGMNEAMEALVKAAKNDQEIHVRCEAIKALAVLADDIRLQDSRDSIFNDELVEALVELANDKHELIRTEIAFALGTFVQLPDADPRLQAELVKLLDDLYPYARYNAATALARQGSLLAVPALEEMLDLESLAVSVKADDDPTFQTFNRNTILKNALQSALNLKEKNPTADLTSLKAAVDEFIEQAPQWQEQGGVPKELIIRAREVRAKL
jgi:HEAT repeat protein